MMDTKAIFEVIDELGSRLSGTATHVWELMVRQQYTDGVVSIVTAFSIIAFSVWLFFLAKKCYKLATSDDMDSELGGIIFGAAIVCAIGGVVLICFNIGGIGDGLKHIMNPEYYALKDLMSAITKK